MTFRVTLLPSGHAFETGPGESILRNGLSAGFALPFSCKQGVCRNCRGKLVEGKVDIGDVHPAYLPEELRAKGFIHLCQASALTDVAIEIRELDGLAGVTIRKVPCRIAKIEQRAPDVKVLHLRLPMNENMIFVAGQHIELMLPGDLRRTYSIASKPSAGGVTALELHIRQIPGGTFTDGLLSKMKERDLLKFEGPLGSFYLRDSEKPVVMVATGTGFAPIKSMLESAFERNIHRQRSFALYWGARTRKDLYMADLPVSWAAANPGFRFIPVLSEATPECDWSGRTGLVHAAVLQDIPDLSSHEVYACGAPAMVAAARADFLEHAGLPEESFYSDPFLTQADTAKPIR
jgi:CDP-4-dehydro-6-deoxyglucose reductase